MKITYCDTKICAKEVHSDAYEEELRFLKHGFRKLFGKKSK